MPYEPKPKRRISFDFTPMSMLDLSAEKWNVFFTLNNVEFATGPVIDTEEEAREIMSIVHQRVGEWADMGRVWEHSPDDPTVIF